MMDYQLLFQQKLTQLKAEGNYRYFLTVNKSARHFPHFYFDQEGNRQLAINFCSNDYLGMSTDEDVIGKFSYVLHESGTGNLSETTKHHLNLENAIRQWHQKEAALVFSGALDNLTVLQNNRSTAARFD